MSMIAHVINPGISGVKLACAVIEPGQNPAFPSHLQVSLTREELPLEAAPDELGLDALAERILEQTAAWPAPDAVVGRGGLMGRVPAGTYHVTPELARYVLENVSGSQPADDPNPGIGAPLALRVAQARGVPAYIVDPQSVDELLPEAHMTGVPGVRREARFHALNARAVARRAAYEVGKQFREARVVVAHLGVTTSVTAFDQGRAIDTTGTAPDGGPMGARQSGPLPTRAVIRLLQTQSESELLRLLTRGSGFFALTGTADLSEIERRQEQGEDSVVQTAIAAFVHQVCKAIGEQTAALPGRPDAVALTGGIARWDAVVDRIERRLAWVAPFIVLPGELELEALAEGAGRVLLGLEGVREWTPEGVTLRPAAPLVQVETVEEV
uniref:Probable butyrate kinase n=2 Tax=Deinococcus radiodurans TaxID=1299 RepID=BUK_DEIRA|nr:RecName: Full=Probable butyrate kinase; Short=BK; AltName: Full=Branched-chain carboxylic acid kinase [Deinococcus radiodurans R1 = ATCC 13939 = DSM 20539]